MPSAQVIRRSIQPALYPAAVLALAALTALVTTLVAAPAGNPAPPGAEARAGGGGRGTGRAPQPVGGAPVDLPALREQLRDLGARVAALEDGSLRRRPSDPGAGRESLADRIGRLLARVKGVEQGEQQLVLEMAVMELVKIGPPAIAPVTACLATGEDRVYRRGYSRSGGRFRSYPRYRTVLFDVLTQIGTPRALSGLLAAVEAGDTLPDYRDLLLLFDRTGNERMIEGIHRLVPRCLELASRLSREELQERNLDRFPSLVSRWIDRHDLVRFTDELVDYLKTRREPGFHDVQILPTLVRLSQEEAFRYVEDRVSTGMKPGSVVNQSIRSDRLPLARRASWFRGLMQRYPVDETLRTIIYFNLPTSSCTAIKEPSARKEDARVMLSFIAELAGRENDENRRRMLDRTRKRLANHIASLSPR